MEHVQEEELMKRRKRSGSGLLCRETSLMEEEADLGRVHLEPRVGVERKGRKGKRL